jgi:HEPN domain-containing protein
LRQVDTGRSKDYITKAENSLRMAEIAVKEEAYDNAVMSSVHSAINALDALTTSYLGKRASGSHTDVLGLVKEILDPKDHSDLAKQFVSLLSLKNASEYEPELMKKGEAEVAVLRAKRILAKVKTSLGERK